MNDVNRLTYSHTFSLEVWKRCAPYTCISMPVSGSASLYALPPRCERRSSTRTLSPSSLAQRSAMVSPKNPEPTTTRSGWEDGKDTDLLTLGAPIVYGPERPIRPSTPLDAEGM